MTRPHILGRIDDPFSQAGSSAVTYDAERVRAWLGRQKNMGLILSILAVYAAICVAAYFGNRQFMYFPDPARIAPEEAGLDGVEEVEISATDGTMLVAWQAPAKEGKPTILYFHGNGANAVDRAPRIAAMGQDGLRQRGGWPRSCWNRPSHQRSMWPRRRTFGCRFAFSLRISTTTSATFAV